MCEYEIKLALAQMDTYEVLHSSEFNEMSMHPRCTIRTTFQMSYIIPHCARSLDVCNDFHNLFKMQQFSINCEFT